jgi:hypothetical protein
VYQSSANRLNKTAAILEVTSLLPQVRNAPYANSISPAFHGIPQNLDSPKITLVLYVVGAATLYDLGWPCHLVTKIKRDDWFTSITTNNDDANP